MKLLSLGHSSFLLEMESSSGESIRILGDPWLSDYAIGDAMGRFPRVRLDYDEIPEIHGLFITHSHTDHFDPYSLLDLWESLPSRPVILLPSSLSYLAPLLEEFLEGCDVTLLEQNQPLDFFGLSLTGLFNIAPQATNEDDVMVLVVESGSEVFFNESDAVLPLQDPIIREAISTYLGSDDDSLDTAVFLTTKNELGATMASVHATNSEERVELVSLAEETTQDEISQIYDPVEHGSTDLWQHPSLIRLIGGQGLCYPQALETDWNQVLFPISVADRVDLECEVADQYDYEHQILEFENGLVHVLEDGELVERQECEWLELLDDEDDREYDENLELFEEFPLAPLRSDSRDLDAQESKILEKLNDRFLPYLIGQRQPPIEHLLSDSEGSYVVRIRYGNTEQWEDRDYAISFAALRFARVDEVGKPEEAYWANDLDDFLEGRADDFTTFSRRPLESLSRRFWDCLGMPFLNDDLVEKKHRLHFERAQAGESIESFILPLYDFEAFLDDEPEDDEEAIEFDEDADLNEENSEDEEAALEMMLDLDTASASANLAAESALQVETETVDDLDQDDDDD